MLPVGCGFTATTRAPRPAGARYATNVGGANKEQACKFRTMEGSVFQFTPGQRFVVSPEAQESFDKNGYILVR